MTILKPMTILKFQCT